MQLSQRTALISEPQTYKMARISGELNMKGGGIIDLSIGESDFDTPEFICAAATRAMREGHTKYTPVRGYPELIEAIRFKLRRENKLLYDESEIMVSTGAKQSLANILNCTINSGDEVLLPVPCWLTYVSQVRLAGGTVKTIRALAEDQYKMRPEMLEAAITSKSKVFMFSSPCNPTGAVYGIHELEALCEVFERHPQILIISDEIYEYINYIGSHTSIACFPTLKHRVIMVNGMSKGFAMTGWRIGYMAGPEWLVSGCERFQAQFTSGANSIAQYAAAVALNRGYAATLYMLSALRQRRDFFIRGLNSIPRLRADCPDGAFYAFPDVRRFIGLSDGVTVIRSATDLAAYLLEHARVATVDGASFYYDDHLRISYARSIDVLEIAIERIRQALSQLH